MEQVSPKPRYESVKFPFFDALGTGQGIPCLGKRQLCKHNLLNVLSDFLIFSLFNSSKFSLYKKSRITRADHFSYSDNLYNHWHNLSFSLQEVPPLPGLTSSPGQIPRLLLNLTCNRRNGVEATIMPGHNDERCIERKQIFSCS